MARADFVQVYAERFDTYDAGKPKKRTSWRWHRIAPNGEIVGSSSEGYQNRAECVANAKRGMTPCEVR